MRENKWSYGTLGLLHSAKLEPSTRTNSSLSRNLLSTTTGSIVSGARIILRGISTPVSLSWCTQWGRRSWKGVQMETYTPRWISTLHLEPQSYMCNVAKEIWNVHSKTLVLRGSFTKGLRCSWSVIRSSAICPTYTWLLASRDTVSVFRLAKCWQSKLLIT